MKVLLFWSPTCRYCPPAKEMIHELHDERKDFELELVSESTPNAREMYLEYQVQSTPTFIIQGPGYEGNIGIAGNQGKKVMNKYLDVAAGKKKLEDEKGWLSRVLGL